MARPSPAWSGLMKWWCSFTLPGYAVVTAYFKFLSELPWLPMGAVIAVIWLVSTVAIGAAAWRRYCR